MQKVIVTIALLMLLGCSSPAPPPTIPKVDITSFSPETAVAIKKALQDVASNGNAANWTTLGLYLQAHGFSAEAIVCYRAAIDLPNTPFKVNYWLALSLAKLGQYEEAILQCGVYENYAPAFWRQGYWHIDLDNVQEAESAFNAALHIDEQAVAALVGQARMWLQRNNPNNAVEILERISQRGGNHPYLTYLLGTAYQRTGNSNEAKILLAQPCKTPPKWEDPWRLEMDSYQRGYAFSIKNAIAKLDDGNTAGAMADFRLLAKKHPQDSVVLINLANLQIQTSRLDEALETCKNSIRWNPKHVPSQLTMALALMKKGDFSLAQAYVSKAIELKPSNPQSYSLAGKIAISNRQVQIGVLHLERAVAIGSNDPRTREMLGMGYLELKDYEKAAHQFRFVLSVMPNATVSIGGYAVALFSTGNSQKATEILQNALVRYPNDAHLQRAVRSISQERNTQ